MINGAGPSFAENLKEHQIPLIRSSLKGKQEEKQLTLVCLVYTHNNVASVVFHTFVPPCFNYLHVRSDKFRSACNDHPYKSLGATIFGNRLG